MFGATTSTTCGVGCVTETPVTTFSPPPELVVLEGDCAEVDVDPTVVDVDSAVDEVDSEVVVDSSVDAVTVVEEVVDASSASPTTILKSRYKPEPDQKPA
jgi:hypothetical protein